MIEMGLFIDYIVYAFIIVWYSLIGYTHKWLIYMT